MLKGGHAGFHLGAWLSTAFIVALTLWIAARPRPPVGDGAWEPRIALCGKLAVGYLVVSFIGLNLLSGTDEDLWTVPSPHLTYLYGALTLAQGLFILPVLVRTIPRPEAIADPPPGRRSPAPRANVLG